MQFFGVNLRDEKATADAFDKTFGLTYPSFNDKDGGVLLAVSGLVPPGAVPTTLVVDKQGRVASRVLGEIQKGTLKALIAVRRGRVAAARTVNSPFAEAILNGSLLLAIPVALLAGLVSFLSPCVLPLVPGYLGYVTGLTGVDLQKQKRGRMLAGIGLFVLGFSVIFVLLGGAFGQLGSLISGSARTPGSRSCWASW